MSDWIKVDGEVLTVEDIENLQEQNKKLRECTEECLTIVAHIDSTTYTTLGAIYMMSKEMLKCLAELDKE